MISFLQLNTSSAKKFIIITCAFHVTLLGLRGLEILGLGIPLLRQFIGTIYLIFIPGFVLLRILKIYNISPVENILHTIGLSIFFLMLIGCTMNVIFPIIGVLTPLSTNLILVSTVVSLSILTLLSLRGDEYALNFVKKTNCELFYKNKSKIFFLLLVPLLSIIGTFFVNYYNNKILLFIVILTVSSMPILILYEKIPDELIPLSIFSIATSLLFSNSLISSYLWGWDIFGEYHYSNLVYMNSYWNPNLASSLNSMASVTIFAPLFSKISGVSVTYFFKFIYPLLFSAVPVGLYEIFKKQTDRKVAFVGVFLFISTFSFYGEMLSLMRQGIAEIFFVLILLLLFEENVDPLKKNILQLVYTFSLIISHYSVSYIFIFLISITFILSFIIGKRYQYKNTFLEDTKTVSVTFITFVLILAIAWYIYTSSSENFTNLIEMINIILSKFYTDVFSPQSTQGLALILSDQTQIFHELAKYITIFTQVFIAIGFLMYVLNFYESKFNFQYIAMSFACLLLNLAGLVVPFFALSLNFSRIYHITLLLLSPFFMLGFSKVLNMLNLMKVSNLILSFILILYFLLHSGFIFEITNEDPSSVSLSNENFRYFFVHESDLFGAKWLSKSNFTTIYGDYYDILTLRAYSSFPEEDLIAFKPWTNVENNAPIFVRSGNLYINNKSHYSTYSQKFTTNMNKVYDDNCNIYSYSLI
jgi:Predicted membrane protein